MVCGKGAGVPLGIGSRFGWAAGFAPRQPRAAAGGQIQGFGRFDAKMRPVDAEREVSYGKGEVAGRMRAPLGIGFRGGSGSERRRSRRGAREAAAAAGSGAVFFSTGVVEIVG